VDVLDRLLDLLRGGVLGVEARRLAEDCVIVKVFCPLSPRKFVFMSRGHRAAEHHDGEHERHPRVRSVQRRIGR
jgi:hypothetical protein